MYEENRAELDTELRGLREIEQPTRYSHSKYRNRKSQISLSEFIFLSISAGKDKGTRK